MSNHLLPDYNGHIACAEVNIYQYSIEINRPCYLLKPHLLIDGDMWCALFGENLQDGVAGFGKSPELAYADFDRAWGTKLEDGGEE